MSNVGFGMPGGPAFAAAQSPKAQVAPTASGGSSTTGTSSVNSLSSTFLNLLVQELQNQDPTAPMDSTAMVGQMISLNQLNQLASINQTLTTQLGGAAPAASSGASGGLSVP